MNSSLTKVEMIEHSLSCFQLGLFGLLPVIGIPMAVRALVCTTAWPPASRAPGIPRTATCAGAASARGWD